MRNDAFQHQRPRKRLTGSFHPEQAESTIVGIVDLSMRKKSFALLAALTAMLASACCALLWMDAVGKISGWTGLPKYEAQIPRLERLATLWSSLTLILPFLAALLLGFGKDLGPNHPENNPGTTIVTYPEVSPESIAATVFITYLLRLAISVLGAVGFLIVFILVVLLLQKLGMQAH